VGPGPKADTKPDARHDSFYDRFHDTILASSKGIALLLLQLQAIPGSGLGSATTEQPGAGGAIAPGCDGQDASLGPRSAIWSPMGSPSEGAARSTPRRRARCLRYVAFRQRGVISSPHLWMEDLHDRYAHARNGGHLGGKRARHEPALQCVLDLSNTKHFCS
jgi:hypothetical protein